MPRFLQGVYPFVGKGLTDPYLLTPELSYTVPDGKRTQPTYLRAGNSSAEMITLVLMRNGVPMRFFPIGAKSDAHVALAVLEDLTAGTHLDIYVGAPQGVSGTVVVDIGMVEI